MLLLVFVCAVAVAWCSRGLVCAVLFLLAFCGAVVLPCCVVWCVPVLWRGSQCFSELYCAVLVLWWLAVWCAAVLCCCWLPCFCWCRAVVVQGPAAPCCLVRCCVVCGAVECCCAPWCFLWRCVVSPGALWSGVPLCRAAW